MQECNAKYKAWCEQVLADLEENAEFNSEAQMDKFKSGMLRGMETTVESGKDVQVQVKALVESSGEIKQIAENAKATQEQVKFIQEQGNVTQAQVKALSDAIQSHAPQAHVKALSDASPVSSPHLTLPPPFPLYFALAVCSIHLSDESCR